MKSEIKKTASCDGCKKLEDKLNALIEATFAGRPSDIEPPVRCSGCGYFVTRYVTQTHPVMGQTGYYCCDSCNPKDVYGDGKATFESKQYGSDKLHAWAFRINEALRWITSF